MNYWTDNECVDVSRLPGQPDAPSASDFFVTCLIIGFFILMYALRPKSLRQSAIKNTKDRDNAPGSGDDPSPPPATN